MTTHVSPEVDSRAEIVQGVAALQISLRPGMLERLTAFLDLLAKWNRVYNLSSVRDRGSMVRVHLLDSLAVAQYVPQTPGADVGSGAGFPGIPLAIVEPARQITLIESRQKRSAFLRQAASELQLTNIAVVGERAERWHPHALYGWAISRAFANLADFVQAAWHLVAPGGLLLAMKGVYPGEELAALPGSCRVREVLPIAVPGLDAQRHLVILERA